MQLRQRTEGSRFSLSRFLCPRCGGRLGRLCCICDLCGAYRLQLRKERVKCPVALPNKVCRPGLAQKAAALRVFGKVADVKLNLSESRYVLHVRHIAAVF